MFINKIGKEHLEYGMNCQDYGCEAPKFKLVCDGCSEGLNSEVGAKLFCLKMLSWRQSCRDITQSELDYSFRKIVDFIGHDPQILKDYMSFTILNVSDYGDNFLVSYCGDGYVITEDYNEEINFIKLDNGEYPEYYIYNFIPKNMLKCYTNGVDFIELFLEKEQYKYVGVASDGLRFILKEPELLEEFKVLLHERKETKLKRFINKHQAIFKDDITIVF